MRNSADVEAIRDAVRPLPGAAGAQGAGDHQLRQLPCRAGDPGRVFGHGAATWRRRYYTRVTRYTTSAFLRVKLGEALRQRGLAPHIFESAERARADLDDGAPGP